MVAGKQWTDLKSLLFVGLFAFTLIGCGGGTSAVSEGSAGSQTTSNSTPSPSPSPSPTPAPPPSAPPPTGTGTAALSWFPPLTHEDGSTLNDLAGHNVYMDSGSGFVKIDSTSSGVSDYIVEGLPPGTYTFVVTAFDSKGIESSYSTPASKTIF